VGRFLPPDHSLGDEGTIGGYMAVHARPAAFQGSDGSAYSVAIEVDETGDAAAPVGAYLLFVQWSPGSPAVVGHLESEFLARGASDAEVRARLGAMRLDEVKSVLDALVRRRSGPERPWWEVARDA